MDSSYCQHVWTIVFWPFRFAVEGYATYSPSRSSSSCNRCIGDPSLWRGMPRDNPVTAQWQIDLWCMVTLSKLVQREISCLSDKLNFYSLALWQRKLAVLSWTGIMLQGRHGEVYDFLDSGVSQREIQWSWHRKQPFESILCLELVSISVLAGNQWAMAILWCGNRDGTRGSNFLAFLPEAGIGI